MSKLEEIYASLEKLQKKCDRGISALELSEYMKLDRANISRYLNILYKENRVDKTGKKPVIYSISAINNKKEQKDNNSNDSFNTMIGADLTLQVQVQQAKAAMLYPPHGLHTLLLGETGVGKSMFAEMMYKFAIGNKILKQNAPFIRFNCADYADNPQLVIAQIFGVKKGAYTGADTDKEGLLKKADGGIIFLDEIHRLSPQAQEMLFTYIDKGSFRPLGETEKVEKVEAQIISATTEDPKSFMLRTFTRRIPMIITLPPLKVRTVKERYYLMEKFIRDESERLNKSIYFNKNAFISFLLYDCPNNIGQLKSDIQLACAKAFLNYKIHDKSVIIINQSDLSSKVKKGLMKLQNFRDQINELLENMGDVLEFSYEDDENKFKVNNRTKDECKNKYFYDIIESKFKELKLKGLDEKEISEILNIDINKYFKKYIDDLKSPHIKDEISKIVDNSILNIVDQILTMASQKLNRQYDEKVYLGLALHLQGSIERIKRGIGIYHPKLNSIRNEYSDEFYVAMEAAKIIDTVFDLKVPLDEVGYLTMFISTKPYEDNEIKKRKVKVLVIMHGYSTATSMAEVANTLIGEKYAAALDMPLTMKSEKMYEIAKEKIIELNNDSGILLLVDMGSLTNFGDMISEETGIKIKTIDMVTTLMVIEAVRKAINGRSLDDIYRTCNEINRGIGNINNTINNIKGTAIITSCFTGEGSAEKIKQILNNRLKNNSNIKIISLNILDRKEFIEKVESIRRELNIIAIVGTVNITIDNIPFIPAPDILTGEGIKKLDKRILEEQDYEKLSKSVDNQLSGLDGVKLVMLVRKAIIEIEEKMDVQILHDVEIGIVLHMCILIDNRIKGGKDKTFEKLNEYRQSHAKEFIMIKQSLRLIESSYNISITDSQVAFIIRIMSENNISV